MNGHFHFRGRDGKTERTGSALLCILLAMATFAAAEPTDPNATAVEVAEPLKPFLPFVDKCRQWHARDRGLEWKTIHDEKFDQGAEYWSKIDRNLKVQKTDGKDELVVAAPVGQTLFAPIGPKVNGQFAIEIVARVEGQKANPISIMLGMERGEGPGFQFSTRPNGEHKLWHNGSPQAEQFIARSVGFEPKLEVKRPYRIRLEVRKDKMTVSIDGKPFTEAPVVGHYDWTKLRQPSAMTVIEPMVVSSFRIEQLVADRSEDQQESDAATWKKLFGEATREQVEAEAARLVPLLDDDSWEVREAATRMLRDVGKFALPALRDGLENGSAEVKLRAEMVLESIEPRQTSAESENDEPAPEGFQRMIELHDVQIIQGGNIIVQ